MNELKIYKQLTMIKLKDWSVLQTEMSAQDLAVLFNQKEFIVIDWVWFNRYEVKTFEEYKPNDVDCFILSQPKDKRERLQKKIDHRRKENLRVNIDIVKDILTRF